ncbi:MAG: hypothetical protein ACOC6G_02135 [Thermoproteota archaeon]
MPQNSPSKDEAFEALDFIINVLREHEKDLDRLINDLGAITDRLGSTEDISGKIEDMEEKLATLQDEVTNLITYLSTTSKPEAEETYWVKSKAQELRGPQAILRCRKWEDFRNMAARAQTVSFLYKDTEKKFQVDALKGNQVINYRGEIPEETVLLKEWLSRELKIPRDKILEGVLALG